MQLQQLTIAMSSDPRLLSAEDALKERHILIINEMSNAELKKFKKHEYKKTVLSEMGYILPDLQKKRYDQTAQCVVNFLHSEVQSLLRKPQSSSTTPNILSETVLVDLDSTMQPDAVTTDCRMDTDDPLDIEEATSESTSDNTTSLNDSVTKLKEIASTEAHDPKSDNKNKSETASQKKIPNAVTHAK